MGKKSKRNRTSSKPQQNDDDAIEREAPNRRTNNENEEEEETMENLKFEDPFVDEYIVEDAANDDDDDEKMQIVQDHDETKQKLMNATSATDADVEVIQSWHPLMGENVHNVELEMDPSAYKMYHTLGAEWPSLSFDFLKDDLGDARQRFPHSLQAVIGTQADDSPQNNQLSVLKLSDLSKLPQEENDDELDDDDDDSSGSDDDDEDEALDLDPILEHYHIPHYGGVNRIRAMPQDSNIVATWSDVGNVYLYDIESIRSRFSSSIGKNIKASSLSSPNTTNKPFFTYSGHDGVEGYAMDWSSVNKGHLATGDNEGNIHLWTPESKTDYSVVKAYESATGSPTISIEDIQWSPTEATVFCAAESGGHVAIYDTRAPNKYMLRHCIHPGTDVNVASWNHLVSNLLATGADDGTLAVWDLRHFSASSKDASKTKPLARFTCHKTPITSVEWHPTDESMLAVSDTVGAYVYDLSVEEDTAPNNNNSNSTTTNLVADIPPQLLFCHSGSQDFKELHWHPQISSCIMTTAYSGFSMFIPSNL